MPAGRQPQGRRYKVAMRIPITMQANCAGAGCPRDDDCMLQNFIKKYRLLYFISRTPLLAGPVELQQGKDDAYILCLGSKKTILSRRRLRTRCTKLALSCRTKVIRLKSESSLSKKKINKYPGTGWRFKTGAEASLTRCGRVPARPENAFPFSGRVVRFLSSAGTSSASKFLLRACKSEISIICRRCHGILNNLESDAQSGPLAQLVEQLTLINWSQVRIPHDPPIVRGNRIKREG